MNPTTQHKLKRFIGYPAFFSAVFSLMLYLTFPYGIVAEQLTMSAKKSGYDLTIGSIGPGFFGVTAKHVSLMMPKSDGAPAGDRKPIDIPVLRLRPTLFPPSLGYSADISGGTISGRIGVIGKPKFVAKAKDLDLAKSSIKDAIGLDLTGKLNLQAELNLDPEDSSKMTGRIALTGDELLIAGGTVANYDLPRVDLGRLEAEIKLAEGKATVQSFKASGTDLEATVEGDIQLAQRLPLSMLRLKLKFKPGDDFMKKNSMIQTGLNFAASRDANGYYSGSIERALGSPNFRLIR